MMRDSIEAAGHPPIVFAVDNGYVQPLCVALLSLSEAHPAESSSLRVLVLHEDLGARSVSAVEQLARALGLRVDLLEGPSATALKPVSGWWSRAVYLRLAIPEMLPADRVALYLDADTLILDSLLPLLATDVTDVCLAAVRDPLTPVLAHGNKLPGWRQLGLDGQTEYFNSGVMLMNLANWRKESLSDQCWTFLDHNRDHVRFWDQDSLNFVVANRWRRLDRRWNTFPLSSMLAIPGERYPAEAILPLSSLLSDEATAAILHFAGPVKPWSSSFPPGPAREAYERFSDKARDLVVGQ
jgi:lipopolysaccharide biosynthesis glycosyltransferase